MNEIYFKSGYMAIGLYNLPSNDPVYYIIFFIIKRNKIFIDGTKMLK